MSVSGLEQYKIDRLLELRAIIDALRSERASVPWLESHASLSRLRRS